MDFVIDTLADGRRLKVLTLVDDFTKEAVDIVVDRHIPGACVTRVLDRAATFRGLPKVIRTDQGSEFTDKALDQWAYRQGVQLKRIQPGQPTQNALNESFNGRFRGECLNEHGFTSLAHARAEIVPGGRTTTKCDLIVQSAPGRRMRCCGPSGLLPRVPNGRRLSRESVQFLGSDHERIELTARWS